jgi:integrase
MASAEEAQNKSNRQSGPTRFTDAFLRDLRVENGRKDRLVFDIACPGLGVRVTAKGTKSFIAQWTDPATRRKVREPLGIWGSITIDQARAAARARLGDVAKGINPKAERMRRQADAAREREDVERKRAESAYTFRVLAEEWAALHLAHKKPRYAAEAIRAIYHGLPELIGRPAAQINRADAVDALDKIVKAGKAVTAGRTMAYARACFSWAVKRDKVPANPFADLPVSAGKTERERVLTDTELAEVWLASGMLGYPFGPLYKMAILTLQRRECVAAMRWSELDGDLSRWSIPGPKMKSGKPHDVQLSEAARAVLRGIARVKGCDFVFSTTSERASRTDAQPRGNRKREPTPISGFSQGKKYLDAVIQNARAEAAKAARCDPVPLVPWRLHDLRRTGVTKLAELGFDSIVVDKLLAHQPAKLRGVAAVYQRHEFTRERAAALNAWAQHVLRVATNNARGRDH